MNEKSQFEAVHMDIFDIPPHPAADAFPMMEEEELGELAQDIKDNGLQQPLVIGEIDSNPVLIDGRNRREACKRAGIVPHHVLLDGQDAVTYILSVNINRRHMTKSQRAMVVARVLETNHVSQRKAADSLRIKQPIVRLIDKRT
jgi:ParB/RepB/Spo0J family partition protein